ncbi:MAG: PEP-CTERM sorting domain-containing protein [Stellaceae bacterium]
MRVLLGFMSAVVLGAAGAISGTSPALAVPITYTGQLTATGSLGGAAFTNANVVLTLHTDTANVTGGPTVFTVTGPATLSIAGGAPVAFTDTIGAVSVPAVPTVGFSDFTLARAILGVNSPAFSTYMLKTAIGPVTSNSGFTQRVSFPTAGGAFVIIQDFAPFVFTATTAVPEPSMAALFGAGLLMLGIAARRRRPA